MKKIGFFGGTFDPIHFGHLNLAIQIAEQRSLDRLFFCPANYSPHKESERPVASKEQRKEMVLRAIAPIPQFSLCDEELKQQGASYTIDTIRKLMQQMPNSQFFLILGEDALEGLHSWKESEALIQMAHPLIGNRLRKAERVVGFSDASRTLIEKGMTPISLMEVSSTQIRQRLQKKRYCGHLLPENVLLYINQYELYQH